MKNFHFSIVIEQDENGWTASCPTLQGCYSQGETYEELMENIKDAIRLHVADRDVDKEEILQPEYVSLGHVDIALEE